MKITSTRNPAFYAESPLLDNLDKVDQQKLQAGLAKFIFDGGEAPGHFNVWTSWGGRKGIVLESKIRGVRWAIQL